MTTTIEEEFNTFLASGDPIIGISDEQRNWILPFIETLRISWLRSEIEKLDNMLRDPSDYIDQRNVTQYNYPINTIITRYKKELKELEKTNE